MELRQLESFVAIVRLGGFRRAADELCISQPALSQQIRGLEMELGTTLFERGRRPGVLTQAGHALLTHAHHMLREAQVTRGEMRDFARLERGYVRVGTVSADGARWLPSLLAAFHEAHPQITIEVNQFASLELLRLLKDREIDVACLSLPGRGADVPEGLCLACVDVGRLVFAAPREHRLAARSDVRLEELTHERLIVPSQSTVSGAYERAFRDRGLQPPAAMHVGDQRMLLQLVAVGLGIGLTSRARMADFPELQLQAIDPVDAQMETTGAAVWVESSVRNDPIKALVEVINRWVVRPDRYPGAQNYGLPCSPPMPRRVSAAAPTTDQCRRLSNCCMALQQPIPHAPPGVGFTRNSFCS